MYSTILEQQRRNMTLDALRDDIKSFFDKADSESPSSINQAREQIRRQLKSLVSAQQIESELLEKCNSIPSVFFEGVFYYRKEDIYVDI